MEKVCLCHWLHFLPGATVGEDLEYILVLYIAQQLLAELNSRNLIRLSAKCMLTNSIQSTGLKYNLLPMTFIVSLQEEYTQGYCFLEIIIFHYSPECSIKH